MLTYCGQDEEGGYKNSALMKECMHPFQVLPNSIMSEIIEYLSLTDGRKLFQTCSYLMNVSSTIESHREKIDVVGNARVCCPLWLQKTDEQLTEVKHNARYLVYPPINENFNNLVTLNLGHVATDEILRSVQNQLPNLQELHMIGGSFHDSVSDIGFLSLVGIGQPKNGIFYTSEELKSAELDMARCRTLRYLDITGCDSISFYATILLRERLTHPELIIRRQPAWMDGHYATPYPNDGVHTYFADGSFIYDRSSFNCGYVCDLWQWSICSDASYRSESIHRCSIHNPGGLDAGSYGNSLHFINFQRPNHWPIWTVDFFFPGVSLIPCTDDNCSEDGRQLKPLAHSNTSVVVVQSIRGIFESPVSQASPVIRNMSNSTLPLGKSLYKDKYGEQTSNEDIANERVTRMHKYPIEDMKYSIKEKISDPLLREKSFQRNCYMPPDHLVAAIRTSEEERIARNMQDNSTIDMYSDDSYIRSLARSLHISLMSGSLEQNDVPDRFLRLVKRRKRILYSR